MANPAEPVNYYEENLKRDAGEVTTWPGSEISADNMGEDKQGER